MRAFKKYISSVIGLCLLVFFVSSCAFSPVKRPVIDKANLAKSKDYNFNADDLYKTAADVILSLGYIIKEKNDDAGYIITHAKQVQIAGNCDCGTWNGKRINGYAGSVLRIKIYSIDNNNSQLNLTSALGTKLTRF